MASTRFIDRKGSMAKNNNNGKMIHSQAAMNKAIKSICDILRRDKAKGARLYVPELTWMFFLRYLDLMEFNAEQRAKALETPLCGTLCKQAVGFRRGAGGNSALAGYFLRMRIHF